MEQVDTKILNRLEDQVIFLKHELQRKQAEIDKLKFELRRMILRLEMLVQDAKEAK